MEQGRIVYAGKGSHSLIRYRNNTYIRLDGAERVVGCLGTGLGDGIEQGALSYIRKSYDSEFHIDSPVIIIFFSVCTAVSILTHMKVFFYCMVS